MRQFRVIAVLAIITVVSITSCKKESIDPVNDVTPVDTTFWAGNVLTPQGDTVSATVDSRFDLTAFRALGQKGDINRMRKMVDEHRVELTANIVAHFPELTQPDSIHFELWTGHVKEVQSGDGNTYSGEIRNELVFRITDPKVKTIVFLACGNGMLSDVSELERQGLTRIDFGKATPWLFVIERGQGLANHIDSLQDWVRVAKDFPVPIKDVDGKVVSPDKCLTYKGKWTTLLFTGDTIDMVKSEVRNSHGRVDFERRQLETEKANAEAVAKAKAIKAKAEAKKKAKAKAKTKPKRR
jgi:hypothetical protein